MSRRMIDLLIGAKGNPIIVSARDGVRVFPVETNFHRMARRPGGVSRQQALRNVRAELERLVHRTMPAGQAT